MSSSIMGKRKRMTDKHKPPPPPPPPPPSDLAAILNYTTRMESSSKEKPLHSIGTSGVKPISSFEDIMGSSIKLPSSNPSLTHRHNNLSRAILSRLPRHYHGRQYSHQYSTSHAGTTSQGKEFPFSNEKLGLKLACKPESESRHLADRRHKSSRRPDRIRSISVPMDAASSDAEMMECGLCRKLLQRKPTIILETTIYSNDLTIVAVLACGHVYHADCLENRTCSRDRTDPHCPLCLTVSKGVDSSETA